MRLGLCLCSLEPNWVRHWRVNASHALFSSVCYKYLYCARGHYLKRVEDTHPHHLQLFPAGMSSNTGSSLSWIEAIATSTASAAAATPVVPYASDDPNDSFLNKYKSGTPEPERGDTGGNILGPQNGTVFDNGDFSEDSTFPLTDWMAHILKEVLGKNLHVNASTFDHIPSKELYIFPSAVPEMSAEEDDVVGPQGISRWNPRTPCKSPLQLEGCCLSLYAVWSTYSGTPCSPNGPSFCKLVYLTM
jgi:hypothetical protein